LKNKIVQRFYETRLYRSVWRKAKIPIPAAPKTGFPPHNIGGQVRFASTRFWGISEFLPQPNGLWYRTFALKKDLILYLNSSRAASSGEFKFKEYVYLLFLSRILEQTFFI
jgi:hypothetical protein